MKKFLIALLIAALVAIGFGAIRGQAFGTTGDDGCVVHHDAVTHTEYHFAKYTHTKEKSPDVAGFWQNFEPNRSQHSFQGPPSYPTDSRGTWSAKKTNGGPQQGAQGVFQNGQGNSSWFYRQQAVAGTWGDYGPWTKWSPETHTSWELSADPIGSPEFHGSGNNWYREWQARFDGQTRTVTDTEAYDEQITCEEPPTTETPEPTPTEPPITGEPTPTVPPVTDTPTPTVPPVTDTPTPTPPTEEPPVTNPPKENPPKTVPPKQPRTPSNPPRQLTQCVDGAWVVTQGDEVLSIGGSCDKDSVPVPTEAEEEGF